MDRRSLLPLNLVGLLLLFAAPWVEIRCEGPLNQQFGFLRQSAMQAALGQYDSQPGISLLRQVNTEGQLEVPLADIRQQFDQIQTRYRPSAAPLLLGYPLALLIAIVASWRYTNPQRSLIMGVALVVALAILGWHSYMGLPLATEPPNFDVARNEMPQVDAGQAGRNPPPRLNSRWMPPFYLSWMGLLAAIGLTFREYRNPQGDDAGRYG